jgi:exo-beta-1,3-glucanase (GH17 family)
VEQPVTTDDLYPPWLMNNQYTEVEQVVAEVDFISLHDYAFIDAQWESWNWRQIGAPEGVDRAKGMMAYSVNYTKQVLANVRMALAEKGYERMIILGEIGWKDRATKIDHDPLEIYRAHPFNQKVFFDEITNWVYGDAKDETSPSGFMYFEAFDEPWKGWDDGWGLFDVDRNPKYVVYDLYPELAPENPPEYTWDDAVYYIQEDTAN